VSTLPYQASLTPARDRVSSGRGVVVVVGCDQAQFKSPGHFSNLVTKPWGP